MSPTPMSHLDVVFRSLWALMRAWRAHRFGRRRAWDSVPPVRADRSCEPADVDRIVRWIDRVVIIVVAKVFHTRHVCFYRSYVRASILRPLGVAVEVNIGLRNLSYKGDTRGHCWLTLGGRQFAEPTDPAEMYPDPVGDDRQGVHYWIGAADGDQRRRMKSAAISTPV